MPGLQQEATLGDWPDMFQYLQQHLHSRKLPTHDISELTAVLQTQGY